MTQPELRAGPISAHGFTALSRFGFRLVALAVAALGPAQLAAQPSLPYTHGEPTEVEQFAVELINRARANPPAEGIFLTSVTRADLAAAIAAAGVSSSSVRSNFAGYAVKPPLAIHPALLAAARRQAQDQADHDYQGHESATSGTLASRVDAAGYPPGEVAENVLVGIPDAFFAHVCLNIDWTIPGKPNRRTIMNLNGAPHVPPLREIGVGSVAAAGPVAAPFVTTQVFGVQAADQPFLTGVAYRDLDGDGFYTPDAGEPLGGVTVRPNVGDYYAVTSASGGYSIPLQALPPGTTSLVVTFSGGGLRSPVQRTIALSGSLNRKLDLVFGPVPPVVITRVERRQEDLQISHTSHLDYLYRVEYSADLLGPWNLLREDIVGTGSVLTMEDPSAVLVTKRFYRVVQY